MKSLVFDSGPIISLTMNNLLWLLEPLKDRFGGDFVIPEAVKKELIDNPLHTKRFKFEAIQIHRLIENDTLTIVGDQRYQEETRQILDEANQCFTAKGHTLSLVHYAEAAALSTAMNLRADAVVMDEHVTRDIVEHPEHLASLMRHKLRTNVTADAGRLRQLKKKLSSIKILRSVELATVAFEAGLLNKYLPHDPDEHIPQIRKSLLEAVLWGLKTDGCAVSRRDIDKTVKVVIRRA